MAASYVIPIGQLDCWALGGLLALNIKEKGKSNVVMLLEITLGILGIVGLTIYNAFLSGCSIGESYQLWHSSSDLCAQHSDRKHPFCHCVVICWDIKVLY